MGKPVTIEEFLEKIEKSGVVDPARLDGYLQTIRQQNSRDLSIADLAQRMVQDGVLTPFQSQQLKEGKWRRFWIGRYKVLETLETGRSGRVYLCEHKLMKRRVALRILPPTQAADETNCQQFYTEARKLAALDHPNITRVFDVDEFAGIHYLVLEQVEGLTLREILEKTGPMGVSGACYVIRQAALGLAHAEQAGILHGLIHPGNVMVDMGGIVKVLNLCSLGINSDPETIRLVPTSRERFPAYLAPEEQEGCDTLGTSGHVYGLGACLYYCLTGMNPPRSSRGDANFPGNQSSRIARIQAHCPEVTDELAECLGKMMAINPTDRHASPQEVADALRSWTDHLHPSLPEINTKSETIPVIPTDIAIVVPSVPPKLTPVGQVNPNRSSPEPQPAERNSQNDPTAMGDTLNELLRSNTISPSISRSVPSKRPAEMEKRFRRWPLILGIISTASVVFTILMVLTRPKHDHNPSPDPPQLLLVNLSGEKGTYSTLQEALDKATPLDRIEVQIPLEESVVLMNKYRLTIEGTGTPDQGSLLWKPPAKGIKTGTKNSRLLEIGNSRSCTIKGFTFNCQGTTANAINLWGECSGLHLQNLKIENYTQSGIHITNATGSASDPIVLQGLGFSPQASAFHQKPSANAILFSILPNLSLRKNSHVAIRDSQPPRGYANWVSNSAGSPFPENVELEKAKIHQQ